MDEADEVPPQIVARLRSVCMGLPQVYEEPAWVGTRWRVRGRTIAHVVMLAEGRPQAFVRAVGADGPVCVMTFRAPLPEVEALTGQGHPFFKPSWGADVVGMVLTEGSGDTDWEEVAELLTESYCVLAPRKLVGLVHPPAGS